MHSLAKLEEKIVTTFITVYDAELAQLSLAWKQEIATLYFTVLELNSIHCY